LELALSLALDADVSSPAVARSHTLELVRPWASQGFAWDAGLLVTELVANAVCHAGTDVCVEILIDVPLTIRVEVSDGSFAMPQVRDLTATSTAGRGLHLVDTIATRWGVRRRIDGKVVWFELCEDSLSDAQPRPLNAGAHRSWEGARLSFALDGDDARHGESSQQGLLRTSALPRRKGLSRCPRDSYSCSLGSLS
jgi:anti-sigma regulatory factor (Ser/Thr protein kinase)